METKESLMSELIYNAESGNHRQFQYLRNYLEYRRARQVRRALEILVASLKRSMSRQFKNYCNDIFTDNADVIKLLAYKAADKVLDFYKEELTTINDMVIEYECYLVNGNLLDFVLGLQRPDDKLWDHRGI